MHTITTITYSAAIASVIMFLSTFPSNAEEGESSANWNVTQTETNMNSLTPIGFLQQQFTHHSDADDAPAFTIYRARVGFTKDITNLISVNLVAGAVEPPNRNPQLVNAFVDFKIDPRLQIRTGQFLVPFGLEGPEPIFLNPAIERSLAVRRLNTLSMFRDIGIRASGSMTWFNYAVAFVNGAGANNPEQNDPKDVMGRIGIAPVEHLELGLSGHLGRYEPGGISNDHYRRYRAGADFTYQFDPVMVRGEYIVREDDFPGDNSISRQGGYILGAYRFENNWQPLVRFEYYDPDTSADNDYLTSWTAGINYYFSGQTRISANYEFRDDRNNADFGNLFTVQMQIAL